MVEPSFPLQHIMMEDGISGTFVNVQHLVRLDQTRADGVKSVQGISE